MEERNVTSQDLIKACKENNLDGVKRALDDGADIEARDDRDGYSALRFAITYRKNNKIIKLLLDRGANIEARDNNGFTALVYASSNLLWSKGNEEIVKLLLENGANIEAKSNDGITALLEASAEGNKEIVKLLLENGADIKNKDKHIKTLLDDNHIKLLAEVEKLRFENHILESGGKGYVRKEERLKTWYREYIENLQKKSLKKIKIRKFYY